MNDSRQSSLPRKSKSKAKAKAKAKAEPAQGELRFEAKRHRSWGGARKGAGRKRTPGKRTNVEHRKREAVKSYNPMHVTLRLVRGLPSLRQKDQVYPLVQEAIELASRRQGFRVIHYSVMPDHVHLLVEADDNAGMTSGMKSLTIRMAKNLNKLFQRKGSVFADRYHVHVLKTPTETFRSIGYVLNNSRKHSLQEGIQLRPDWLDPLSSARTFTGWAQLPAYIETYGVDPPRLPAPKSWLLREGWQKNGRIPLDYVPSRSISGTKKKNRKKKGAKKARSAGANNAETRFTKTSHRIQSANNGRA